MILRPDLERRLAALAELRGEPREATIGHLLRNQDALLKEARARVLEASKSKASRLRRAAARLALLVGGKRARLERMAAFIPTKFPRRALDPRRLPIAASEVLADGTPCIRLTNGRSFLGYPASSSYRFLYLLLQDLLPEAIRAETYELAIQVQQRYCDIACEGLVKAGDTVFEVGAYFGLKALKYADACAPGRVVAVEMMADNEALMRRNIAANGLEGRMLSLHCGVWNAPGAVPAHSSGRQRNSLVDIDERAFKAQATVPVDTLDNLIDRAGVERVDFLNMQVNGAEIEALHGLQRRAADVRLIRIGSHYSRGGVQAAEVCSRLLQEKGFTILSSAANGSVLARGPKQPA